MTGFAAAKSIASNLAPVLGAVFLASTLSAAPVSAADSVDFNAQIRPIISSKCFHCHGPDEAARKGKLRLDVRENATKERSGGTFAIAPNDLAHSELVKRISSKDPEEIMPPPKDGHPLTIQEIALLKKWIQQGAPYEKHWAFVKPVRPALPAVRNKRWPRNSIDHFILAKIEAAKLKPSPPAERSALIRRLSLDLTGLPPAPSEVEAFSKDQSASAYEKLVDRLLASPSFGERWARLWMDLARYADSAGYGSDPLRLNIWPYRDWVINALNRNLPFDQFTIEQLAGDLLENATEEQRTATAFHRNTMTNTEGGTDDEEWRVAAVKDRANVTVQVWMGLTMGCAQCHTHKFDPITQKEYYQFYSFFNQTQDNDQPDERPTMPVPNADEAVKIKGLSNQIAALEKQLETSSPELLDEFFAWQKTHGDETAWKPLEPIEFKSKNGTSFKKLEDHSLLATNPAPATDTYTVTVHSAVSNLSAVRLEVLPDETLVKNGPGRSGSGNFLLNQIEAAFRPDSEKDFKAQFVRIELPGEQRILSLAEVQIFRGKTNSAPSGKASQSSVGFDGPPQLAIDGNTNGNYEAAKSTTHTQSENNPWWEVDLGSEQPIESIVIWNRTDPEVGARLANFRLVALNAKRESVWETKSADAPSPNARFALGGEQPVKFSRATASFIGANHDIGKTIEGKPEPKAGWSANGSEGKSHSAVFEVATQLPPGNLTIKLVQNAGGKQVLGRFRISAAALPSPVLAIPEEIAPALAVASEKRSPKEQEEISKWFRRFAATTARRAGEIESLKKQLAAIKPVMVPVMKEVASAERRTSRMLSKGSYLLPGDEVSPGVPAAFNPWPANAPTNRLGVAQWLMSPENPLTARVTANRFWAQFFGTGIVETEEDFGTQGTLPSHPELLDWLAVELRDSGWNVKQFLKKIVMSATYQQSSRLTPELLQKDPRNRLLARSPRQRLDAETVRDQALALSGLLSRKIGGPSVYPPQPDGLWRAAFNGERTYATSKGEDRYRRGLYTIWRRTVPYPSMATFDAPSRESCSFRRLPTNTPLQAYVTMNDPVYVEAAQALGRRLHKEGGDTIDERIRFGLQLALARPPTKSEMTTLKELYESELARYRSNEKEAIELATKPIGALPPGIDSAEAAAWTVVANVLLNLDGVLTKG